jgi:ribonuclease VapC
MIQNERGGELVADLFADPEATVAMSTLNWSEVIDKMLRNGMPAEVANRQISTLDIEVIDFNREQAQRAARLRLVAGSLSLADRACIAISEIRKATAWTTDRVWVQLSLGVSIELIRN